MIDSRVKFRHLQTFVEVARQKSVMKAAELLHVSQPAVTKTIRELEQVLGVDVFERDGRGIKITRYGEVFLRHAGAALTALRQGLDSVSQEQFSDAPPIRIGALPTVSSRIMPRAMELFLKEKTWSRVKIVTGENAVLLEQLRVGDLDLVVGRLAGAEMMAGFSFEHLYSEQVVFAVRAGHPLLDGRQSLFAGFGNYTVLMPTRGSIIGRLLKISSSPTASPACRTRSRRCRIRSAAHSCGQVTRSGSFPTASWPAMSPTGGWHYYLSIPARPRGRSG